jgi:hypothetical protein
MIRKLGADEVPFYQLFEMLVQSFQSIRTSEGSPYSSTFFVEANERCLEQSVPNLLTLLGLFATSLVLSELLWCLCDFLCLGYVPSLPSLMTSLEITLISLTFSLFLA